MKLSILFTVILGISCFAQATTLVASKDWSAEKDIMTPLEKMGCVAETTADVEANGLTEKWTLQVIKLATGNGDYSYPIILSFPEAQPSNEYFEASARSNRPDSPNFSMTLMQPASGDKTMVANRLVDRNQIVNLLKADSHFTVDYLTKEGPTRSAQFSLRGSSKVIQTMLDSCN